MIHRLTDRNPNRRRDFFSCIREQKPPTIDVYRGLDYTLPGIVAAESIQQGSVPLPVPDPREW